ncbi:MAG: TatD family hydrolase [Desulfarculaceae bacterium]|nr:TatD family hydrolase [Desulfarculaceae bacterium]
MKLFDAHCHLQAFEFKRRISGVMEAAAEAGVVRMVCCGTEPGDWQEVKEIARAYDSVIPAFGVHPFYMDRAGQGWRDTLRSFLAEGSAGVGEIGVDFLRKDLDRELQESIFTEQLVMAKEMHLPASIHVRKGWDTLIHILKRIGPLEPGGVIHSYSGSADLVDVLERYGLYISFSGSVTRPNAKKVKKALAQVSPDRVLIETDSPDILPTTPGRDRDEANEPCNLPVVAKAAAAVRNTGAEEFALLAFENGERLYGRGQET